MKKFAAISFFVISTSASAGDLQNMYGLGALEPSSGDEESYSDRYIQVMASRSSLGDADITNSSGNKLGSANFGRGVGGNVSYGTEFMNPFVWEVELGYNENDVKSSPVGTLEGKLKAYTAMANLLLEADFLPVAQPFFGAGAGYAKIADDNSSDGAFAYQGMGGLTFDIIDNIDIVAEYKYLRANNVEFGNSGSKGKFDYIDQNIELGVRFGL